MLKTCKVCGTSFRGRYGAKFCSGACRQKAKRMRDGKGPARGWYGVREEYKELWRDIAGHIAPETDKLIREQVKVDAKGVEWTLAAVYQTLIAHGVITRVGK